MKTLSLNEIGRRAAKHSTEVSILLDQVQRFRFTNQNLSIYSGEFWRKFYRDLDTKEDSALRLQLFLIRQGMFLNESLNKANKDGKECWSH